MTCEPGSEEEKRFNLCIELWTLLREMEPPGRFVSYDTYNLWKSEKQIRARYAEWLEERKG